MNITRNDLKKQVEVVKTIQKAIDEGHFQESARLLCEEFKRLLNMQSYWQDMGSTIAEINSKHAVQGRKFLGNLVRLVDAESQVFSKLDINDEDSRLVLGNAYGSLKLAMAQSKEYDPSPETFSNLKSALDRAKQVVCKNSKGRLARVRNFLLSWKGVRVLAGGATLTANVLIFPHDGGAISWASVKAGIIIMKGNLEDLTDILSDDNADTTPSVVI